MKHPLVRVRVFEVLFSPILCDPRDQFKGGIEEFSGRVRVANGEAMILLINRHLDGKGTVFAFQGKIHSSSLLLLFLDLFEMR